MTAFAFILGVVPLVHRHRRRRAPRGGSCGTTVLGGMLAATVIAIFIIPVTFYVSERFGRRRSDAPLTAAPLPAPISGGQD